MIDAGTTWPRRLIRPPRCVVGERHRGHSLEADDLLHFADVHSEVRSSTVNVQS